MNESLMIAAGFAKELKLASKGICPFCKKKVHANDFRDPVSFREFTISGLCQICQDKTFIEQ
jgi:hypothetical protein